MGEKKKAYLIDMDGVLVFGTRPIPGAVEFIERLVAGGYKYLILTNNSAYTPLDLQHRLNTAGIDLLSAARLANFAAGVAVRKMGTATVSLEELKTAIARFGRA